MILKCIRSIWRSSICRVIILALLPSQIKIVVLSEQDFFNQSCHGFEMEQQIDFQETGPPFYCSNFIVPVYYSQHW